MCCLDTIISLTEKKTNALTKTSFLRLSKGFQLNTHRCFMNKTKRYGIGENARNFLNSSLCDRKQCVKNGIVKSDWVVINHGASQGTVLGPLIFILCMSCKE